MARLITRPNLWWVHLPSNASRQLLLTLAGGGVLVIVSSVAGYGGPVLGSALLAPLAVALVGRPQRGVLALVALAPFDGLLDLLPHSATLHVWKEVLVTGILLASFVAPPSARASEGRPLPGWYPAVGALLGLGLVSAYFVGGLQAFTGFRIDYFYILLAWAIWRCPPDPRERDRLVTILMATGSFAGAFGLAQQALGFARLHALGYQYNSTIRFTGSHLRSFGTFSYQSPFAYFLMVVLILGVSQALTEPHRARNRLFVASLPVLLGSLLFTFERGAWLGVGVGWLYIGLRRHRTLLLALPPALLVPLYLPAGITSTALSNRSLGQRANGWAANIHQVLLHPLGAGIGATGAAAARVAALQVQGSAPPSGTSGTVVAATYQPDNYYYKTLYEFGVVGMWLLVIFLVAAAVSCHQTSGRLQGRDAALADGVCAFVLAAVVASAVATFFEIYPMDLFTWLLLGTVAVCDPE